ncbi:hypothetical protein Asppvi_009208 [Aspergillus pseudoviridinutans]|uniref:AT hook domain-containing protein family protein n=1 Tax=Aspergillus pseudoviridinutans TaxID=1517512 RepID=A0A9P3BJ33_9EURO|nr:uncharacterized protein Asppvi_009208 [Aspergillus pseudoviridinutans]GIJ90255.1 hypothetical protein Asppvi_009208 [Aspergillus pseudoviridinutans]
MPQTLRSSRRRVDSQQTSETNIPSPIQPVHFITPQARSDHPQQDINLIPPDLTRLPNLSTEETILLRKKQSRLPASASATNTTAADYGPHAVQALSSTLIFAQHEAGTAVCIHPAGWLLTCAHCFGETEAEWRSNRRKWLLYFTGEAVQAECVAWDARRDLALARIIALECLPPAASQGTLIPSFACVPLATPSASLRSEILCIGQPGADDLESSAPRKTAYDLIEISEGRLRGLIPGADPHDNEEIGTLKHDAWTYWGHSGAPLVRLTDGVLLGLHSSWDDTTAMRHGVPLVALREFLRERFPGGWAMEDQRNGEEREVIVIDD